MDLKLDPSCPVPTDVDAVEAALATALEGATAVGRFDVVAQLASELQARQMARMGNVMTLPPKTRQRGE